MVSELRKDSALNTIRPLLTASLSLAILLPSEADARPFRVEDIPNAPSSCNTCHTNGGNSPRNTFGQQVAQNLTGTPVNEARVDWDTLCGLDADGDGVSNGIELGDPDCMWMPGETAGAALSNPADAASAPEPAQMPAPTTDEGGCTATGTNGGATSAAWLLALGVWVTRRRRQGGKMECSPGSEL